MRLGLLLFVFFSLLVGFTVAGVPVAKADHYGGGFIGWSVGGNSHGHCNIQPMKDIPCEPCSRGTEIPTGKECHDVNFFGVCLDVNPNGGAFLGEHMHYKCGCTTPSSGCLETGVECPICYLEEDQFVNVGGVNTQIFPGDLGYVISCIPDTVDPMCNPVVVPPFNTSLFLPVGSPWKGDGSGADISGTENLGVFKPAPVVSNDGAFYSTNIWPTRTGVYNPEERFSFSDGYKEGSPRDDVLVLDARCILYRNAGVILNPLYDEEKLESKSVVCLNDNLRDELDDRDNFCKHFTYNPMTETPKYRKPRWDWFRNPFQGDEEEDYNEAVALVEKEQLDLDVLLEYLADAEMEIEAANTILIDAEAALQEALDLQIAILDPQNLIDANADLIIAQQAAAAALVCP